MASDEEYQRALKGIAYAREHPDAISADALETLVGIVKSHAAPKASSTPADFGEHSSLGPTGGDMLSEKIPVQESPPPKLERYSAPKLPPKRTIEDPSLSEEEQALANSEETTRYRKENFDDESPKNATRRKDLAELAPPSFIPPAPDPGPVSFAHPLDAARAIAQHIENAKAALPASIGGNVEHFYEPSAEEYGRFKADLEQGGYHVPSREEYADMRWKMIYDAAKQQGRAVVRDAYAGEKGIAHGLGRAADATDAALLSFGNQMTLGGLGAAYTKAVRHDREASGESALHPEYATPYDETMQGDFKVAGESVPGLGEVGGGAAGILNPRGLGAGLARGAGSAVRGVAGPTSALGKIAAEGAAGALASGAGAAIEGVTGAVRDERPIEGGDIAARAKIGAMLGLPGGLVAGLAKVHGESLREAVPELPEAEKLGARTSLGGVSPGKQITALEDRAASEGAPSASSMMFGELEKPLVETGRTARAGAQESIAQTNREFYAKLSGKRQAVGPLLKEATQAHAEAMGPGGELAFQQNLPKLREQIGKMADVRIADPAKPPLAGEYRMPVAAADRAGFDVDAALNEAGVPREAAEGTEVAIRPRRLSAEELDKVVHGLDQMQAQGKLTKEPIPRYAEMQRAAREVRDRFSPEFSQTKGANSRALADLERRLAFTGLPPEIPSQGLTADQAKALQSALESAGETGPAAAERARAIRETARQAGVGSELERAQQMRSYERLQGRNSTGGGITLHKGGITEHLNPVSPVNRMRLDAISRMMGVPQLGAAGSAAGGSSQATIDQISNMLNLGTPFINGQ